MEEVLNKRIDEIFDAYCIKHNIPFLNTVELAHAVKRMLLAQRTQIIGVLEAYKADYETQRKQAGFDDTARALDAKILALDQVIKEVEKL